MDCIIEPNKQEVSKSWARQQVQKEGSEITFYSFNGEGNDAVLKASKKAGKSRWTVHTVEEASREKERRVVKSWASKKMKKEKSFSNTLSKTMVGGDDALGQQQQEKEGRKLW